MAKIFDYFLMYRSKCDICCGMGHSELITKGILLSRFDLGHFHLFRLNLRTYFKSLGVIYSYSRKISPKYVNL